LNFVKEEEHSEHNDALMEYANYAPNTAEIMAEANENLLSPHEYNAGPSLIGFVSPKA